jgi:hypothetical protein
MVCLLIRLRAARSFLSPLAFLMIWDLAHALKSVIRLGYERRDDPILENESVDPKNVVELRKRLSQNQVREGMF